MTELKLDLNIDKRSKPTLVIECPRCKHELTHHLETLEAGAQLTCEVCGEVIAISEQDLVRAQSLYQMILRDEDGVIG